MGKSSLVDRMAKAKVKAGVNDDSKEGSFKNALDDIAHAVEELAVTMEVDPLSISRDFNPREFPISLDEIQAITWPSLDSEPAELDALLSSTIEGSEFEHLRVSLRDSGRLLEFMKSIHNLAFRMRDEKQIQEISVKRKSSTSSDFELIAGERRLAAFLYADGLLNKIRCRVYPANISQLQKAKIRDGENHRDELAFYEVVASKFDVWLALPNEEKQRISTTKLGLIWGYQSRGVPTLLRSLFERDDAKEMVDQIYTQRLKKDDVEFLMKAPNDPPQETGRSAESISPANDESPRETNKDIASARAEAQKHFKAAKKYGLTVNRRSNLSVAKIALQVLSKSKQLPADARAKLSEFALDNIDDISRAWAYLGEVLEVDE